MVARAVEAVVGELRGAAATGRDHDGRHRHQQEALGSHDAARSPDHADSDDRSTISPARSQARKVPAAARFSGRTKPRAARKGPP